MYGNRLVAALILIASVRTVTADTVYQWTDTNGQVHYGDIPPDSSHTITRNIDIDSSPRSAVTSLRPVEKQRLRQLQQQTDDRHQAKQRIRQDIRQQLADKQQVCHEARSRMQQTRDHELRKRYAATLRRHCW